MRRAFRTIRRLNADRSGQTTVEWALLLGGVGIPMLYLFGLLLSGLAEHYRMVVFFETLPFP